MVDRVENQPPAAASPAPPPPSPPREPEPAPKGESVEEAPESSRGKAVDTQA